MRGRYTGQPSSIPTLHHKKAVSGYCRRVENAISASLKPFAPPHLGVVNQYRESPISASGWSAEGKDWEYIQ